MAKKKKEKKYRDLGSVYKNKYGKIIGVADLGRDKDGKRIRKQVYYGDSEEEANDAIQKAVKQKKILKPETFKQNICSLMLYWLLNYKQSTVKSRSFENIMINYKKHIEPELKNKEILQVSIADLRKLLKKIEGKEPKRKTKSLLKQFYDFAVVEKYVEYNPVASIDIKEKEDEDVLQLEQKEEYKAIKPEYREKFFTALDNHQFLKSLCLTAYYSGLRIGELLGLRWRDIDFKNKILDVAHAITTEAKFDDEGNKISKKTILSYPKTKSSQTKLPMNNALIQTLQDWKKYQAKKEKEKSFTGVNSFVFCNEEGQMRTYHGTRTILDRFLKDNDLQDCGIHFHAIRHTFGDVLRDNNWSIYDIQKMLRHSKASTTEIYLSMKNDPALDLSSKINEVFDVPNAEEEKQKKRKKQKDFEM